MSCSIMYSARFALIFCAVVGGSYGIEADEDNENHDKHNFTHGYKIRFEVSRQR